MAQQDVIGQVRARFAQPLADCAKRRVVFWHDADGSFEQLFDEAAQSGFDGSRPMRFLKLEEGGSFAAKRAVCREYAADDLLIYTRMPKDLSPRGLEGNWLADVELYAEHFQADFASLLMEELGATDAAVEGVEQFVDFFKAADRREKFKRLTPHAQSRSDVALGVIGSLLGAANLSTECLVRTYLCALADGGNPLGALGKFGADAAFASFYAKRLGYAGDLTALDDMAAHLVLSALSYQLPDGALDGLEGRISAPHGQFCLNVLYDWLADDATSGVLYELARKVEWLCNLDQRFSHMNVQQLVEADVLPCVNEHILTMFCASMGQGADRADEAYAVVQRRKNQHWFSRVEPYFEALEAAVDAQRFYRAHAQGFHVAVPADVWKAYTADWFAMDRAYRDFCRAVDACHKTVSDLPPSLDEALECLASWMERVYVNWFLVESNTCWVNAAQKSWSQTGYVEGVPRQTHFFDEGVAAGSSDVKKTMIIVSDALRYEVAVELAQRLERDTRGSASVKGMQGVFPTVTEFGMAALLPHASIDYDWESDVVRVNGTMPTGSTPEREAVLRARKPAGRCIQSKDLLAAKRVERKGLLGDADVVYVYHNKIDAMGEDYSTEHMVFEACETAVDDLVALVKMASGDLNFSRVLITADHGFLYTREPLEERDKVSQKDVAANTARVGRRYAICEGANPDDQLFIKVAMDEVGAPGYTGLAPRECVRIKLSGPGENYVHGGLSLQECCVPLVQFRSKRAGAKGYEEHAFAQFSLLSTMRRITSMLFKVELFQREAVAGKVLPAEYELVMTDAAGNEVSEVRRARADMTTADETARVARLQFSLKAGKTYDAHAPYYLLCRDKANGAIVWREEYQIDIAFVPMDDFGF